MVKPLWLFIYIDYIFTGQIGQKFNKKHYWKYKVQKVFRIKRVQSISVTIKNNWLVGRNDLLLQFFKYNLRTAISTIGPSEKNIVDVHYLYLFFYRTIVQWKPQKKKRTLLIPVFVFAFLCNSFYYCRDFSHNLYEKYNFNFLFYDFTLFNFG